MVKVAFQVVAFHASMVTVASHAILADQLLMKRSGRERFENLCALGGQTADIGGLMAARAFCRRHPGERSMAGKAIGLELLVPRNELARADHQIRIGKGQPGQDHQVDGQDYFEGPAHIQPQNKKMLKI